MAIKILSPGLATAVQDLGREGYFHLGIPISGGMDRFSLRCANMLVGNDEGAAVLEAVFLGPMIEFMSDAVIAITGATMTPKLNNVAQEVWSAFAVKAGDILSFDYLKSGARIYIAISGGINVPLALGSRSTYTLGALGGFEGRVLAKGDCLALGSTRKTPSYKNIPENLRRMPSKLAELRVIPGLYWHHIDAESQARFFSDKWAVALEADRIGYRFKGGTPLSFVERKQPFGAGSDPSNIVDGCYPYGSIQVPGGTEPIVLHRDAVSGGGYFMLGAVISADMDLIGQLQPNTVTQFVKTDMGQALAARAERREMLENIRQLLN